jgi:hypothetical protein
MFRYPGKCLSQREAEVASDCGEDAEIHEKLLPSATSENKGTSLGAS